jgi:hypothetical protein
MRLSARIDASLPQLAWLAEIDREALVVRATVGSSVEVGSDFLVLLRDWPRHPIRNGGSGSERCAD